MLGTFASSGGLGLSMERELIISGIGGQGVQLMGKTLALAAIRDGRFAMLAAEYGGEMRGGPSQASVVVGDTPLRALPILPSTATAILMHHRHSEFALGRLIPGGRLFVNSSVVGPNDIEPDDIEQPAAITSVPATDLAREAGSAAAAGFAMLGAFVAATQLIDPDRLGAAMQELVPPYRADRIEGNLRAIEAGSAYGRALGATV